MLQHRLSARVIKALGVRRMVPHRANGEWTARSNPPAPRRADQLGACCLVRVCDGLHGCGSKFAH
jgi:hypothetical protein